MLLVEFPENDGGERRASFGPHPILTFLDTSLWLSPFPSTPTQGKNWKAHSTVLPWLPLSPHRLAALMETLLLFEVKASSKGVVF